MKKKYIKKLTEHTENYSKHHGITLSLGHLVYYIILASRC